LTGPTPATEEYLQAVYTLDDEGAQVIAARLADFLQVSPAAVSEMVHRLEREGLLALDERKSVRLTAGGRQIAEKVARRHRLAERLLVDILGYAWWRTHEEAERIEHAMTDEMEERIARALGNPQTCPHGNPMPGVVPLPTRRLEAIPPGGSAAVERIPDQFEHEPGFLEYLDSVGVKPGVKITLVAVEDDGLKVAIEGQERRIRRDCGRKVLVTL
jgi:DtxR family Mn-dependent transcriptional regulator